MNGGLFLMAILTLLPVGLIQARASYIHGLWYARSEEFMQQPLLQTLRWVRTVGDVVFIDHRNVVAIVGTVPAAYGDEIIAVAGTFGFAAPADIRAERIKWAKIIRESGARAE